MLLRATGVAMLSAQDFGVAATLSSKADTSPATKASNNFILVRFLGVNMGPRKLNQRTSSRHGSATCSLHC